jgi:hypothetical protein
MLSTVISLLDPVSLEPALHLEPVLGPELDQACDWVPTGFQLFSPHLQWGSLHQYQLFAFASVGIFEPYSHLNCFFAILYMIVWSVMCELRVNSSN